MRNKIKDLSREEIISYLNERKCNYCPYNYECSKESKPTSEGIINPICCDSCFSEKIEEEICDFWKDCVENDPDDIDYQKEEIEVDK